MFRPSPRLRSFLAALGGQLILAVALVVGLPTAVRAQVGSQGVSFQQLQQQINALAAKVEALEAQVEAMGGQNQLLETLLDDLIGEMEDYRETIEQHEETIQTLRDKMVYHWNGQWLGFNQLQLTGRTVFLDPDMGSVVVINDPLNGSINVSRPVLSSNQILQPALNVNGHVKFQAPPTLVSDPDIFVPTLHVQGQTVMGAHSPINIYDPALRVTGPAYFQGDYVADPTEVWINPNPANSRALQTLGEVVMADGSSEAPFRDLAIFSQRSSPVILREFTASSFLRSLLRVEADPASSGAARVLADQFIATPAP
jgi:outer membrane murein-binding lipoprotein Lpp